ncbi:protein kinase [Sphingomonas sp. ST-64]|uniref:Protein kinase n=1 Tax=Sphingomonas plantiphila TaxID=3163295 RepID=A0ABW8YNI5_9SPHN
MTFMQTRAANCGPGDDGTAFMAGTRVGPWRVEEEIGKGGMGRVYRARRADGLYDQIVAIKSVSLVDEASIARFERERQLLAAMEHPGIARIVDGGTDETGAPYMATEFIDGKPIAEHVAAVGASPAAIARLMIDVANAVGHAHSRLVLHRDIKSDNVLVDQGGRVRLIDFGISGEVDATSAPGGGATIAVAAPEVLAGQRATVRSDVYSLGVLLATLLAGKIPLRDEAGGMEIGDRLPGGADLAAIATKATRADPDARYASADAFAADLTAWREHRPVLARGGGPLYRSRRFLERYWIASALATVAMLSLAGGLIVSMRQTARAEEARALAEYQSTQEEENGRLQAATAEILQQAYSSEEDQRRLGDFMLNYNAAVIDDSQIAGVDKAAMSLAIARHFIMRNDYRRAVPLLERLAGRPDLTPWQRSLADSLLGRGLMEIGRKRDAIARLRRVEQEREASLGRFDLEHAAVASTLAIASQQPEDIRHARAVLTKTYALHRKQAPSGYLENQLAMLAVLQSDFAQALTWFRRLTQSVRATDAGYNSDTSILNLAMAEFFTGNAGAARAALERGKALTARKGESLTAVSFAKLESQMLVSSGDLDGAKGALDRAVSMAEKLDAPQRLVIGLELERAYLDLAQGDRDAAARRLRSLDTSALPAESGLAASVAIASGAQLNPLQQQAVCRSMELSWRYETARKSRKLPALDCDAVLAAKATQS